MKSILKKLFSKLSVDTYQRLLAYSILRNNFNSLSSSQTYSKREALWDAVIKSYVGANSRLIYIEFGVHEGYSLNYFSKQNINEESVFIGLDSFEGLPEDWGTMKKKGTFNTDGKIPSTDDSRVSFIKGWFQNSWASLEKKLSSISNLENLVVHYDADLYSSTLFALSKIDTLKKPYIAIFDEFTGHETRSLFNYCQAYNSKVEFLGKTISNNYPDQVVCRIIPISN
jgi:O-methyltransferase